MTLSEKIGQCCNELEDAFENEYWESVKKIIDKLDELYDDIAGTISDIEI